MRIAYLALLLLSIQSCRAVGPGTSDPSLIGGQQTTAYPAVGQLLDQSDGGLCTATLIGPKLVLTAGHCLDGKRAANLVFRVGAGKNWQEFPSAEIAAHPLYKAPDKGAFHDVGRVILKNEPGITPLEVYAGDGTGLTGKSVLNIGYGVTNADTGAGSGIKRQATSRLTELRETTLRTESTRSNVCDGDSGGPLLLVEKGQALILGVASYVDLNCARYSIYTRIDRYKAFVAGGKDDFPCGQLTEMGQCEDKTRRSCQNGKVLTETCPAACDWDDSVGVYACIKAKG